MKWKTKAEYLPLIINIKTIIYFSDGYAFLGSYILEEVIKEIVPRGLRKAQRLILAGSRYAVLYFENNTIITNVDSMQCLKCYTAKYNINWTHYTERTKPLGLITIEYTLHVIQRCFSQSYALVCWDCFHKKWQN